MPPLNVSESHLPRLSQVLWSTAAIALVSGFAEAAAGVYRHRVDHLPAGQYVAGEVFWMTPAAALFSIAVVTLLWLAVTAPAPDRWGLRRWLPAVAAGLATYGLSSAMSLGIAGYASLILSAGVGLAVHRTLHRWPSGVARLSRVTSAVLVFAAVATAVVVPWRRSARELAALPSVTPPAGVPNVLIFIWDTARAQSMSLYGYPRRTTPVLDSLARQAQVFDRAFATAPWSLPSHASLFTGLYPNQLSAGARIPLDDDPPTIAEFFARNGYATASMTANLFYGSPDYGIDRGFATYDARPPITPRVIAHTWILLRRTLLRAGDALGVHHTLLRRRASHVNDAFLGWLDHRGDRPFFAVLNYFDAHEPYAAPAPFDTLFAPRGTRYWADETLRRVDTSVVRQLRDMYDGGIAYDDHSTGQLIAALRERGLIDRTILVITSDHGEEFGERGPSLIGHNRSLYRQVLHVPLLIVDPRTPTGGVRVQHVASIRDIPATVAELALPGTSHPFAGTPLHRLASLPDSVTQAEPTRAAMSDKHRWASATNDGWPTALGPMYSVLSSTHQYIVDARGAEGLFALASDPFDMVNLATEAPATLEELRRRLEAYVGPPAQRVPRKGARPAPSTPSTAAPASPRVQ